MAQVMDTDSWDHEEMIRRVHSSIVKRCKKCKGTGYDEKELACSCQLKFNKFFPYLRVNIPRDYIELPFKNLKKGYQKICEDLFKKMEPFSDFIERGKFLLIMGEQTGIGKTTMACLFLRWAVDSGYKNSWFVNMNDLNKQILKFDDEKMRKKAFSRFYYSDVLVLDGFGEQFREFKTDWYIKEILWILRKRRQERLTTIITTNFSLKKMRELYGSDFMSLIGNDITKRINLNKLTKDNRLPTEKS